MDKAFQDLWDNSKYGKASKVSSAGAYVCKSSSSCHSLPSGGSWSCHAYGAAFDLHGVFWSNVTWLNFQYNTSGWHRRFTLGVESFMHRHMKWVLGYNYDSAHRDHIHVEVQHTPKYSTTSTSQTKYLQAALTHIYRIPTTIDGIYGNQTKTNTNTALANLGLGGYITTTSVWKEFLRRTGRIGTEKEGLPRPGGQSVLEDVPA